MTELQPKYVSGDFLALRQEARCTSRRREGQTEHVALLDEGLEYNEHLQYQHFPDRFHPEIPIIFFITPSQLIFRKNYQFLLFR